MTKIIIIAALSKNYVIGNSGKIPWHYRDDFLHFKTCTSGFPVIMGRKTFESLPNGVLPNRINIILSRNSNYLVDGAIVIDSLEKAIDYCKKNNYEKIFLIGGARVYEHGLKFADELELTFINRNVDGDTYFPKFDLDGWNLIKKEEFDEFSFNTFIRKTSF